jgi:hypothetical protein
MMAQDEQHALLNGVNGHQLDHSVFELVAS